VTPTADLVRELNVRRTFELAGLALVTMSLGLLLYTLSRRDISTYEISRGPMNCLHG
jgi:hypothetical protein